MTTPATALVSPDADAAAGDRSQPWRELRAGVLDQVGLGEAAAADRASGGGAQ